MVSINSRVSVESVITAPVHQQHNNHPATQPSCRSSPADIVLHPSPALGNWRPIKSSIGHRDVKSAAKPSTKHPSSWSMSTLTLLLHRKQQKSAYSVSWSTSTPWGWNTERDSRKKTAWLRMGCWHQKSSLSGSDLHNNHNGPFQGHLFIPKSLFWCC